ncbi:uncharacterized protein LOC132571442 [Heteronotia binoei]|uniref:uncharacterized protein LOC132571442 n=1 Tax=Heteronotia binoei TaxID=13085 RepID=UPI00292E8C6C|nr:uncharacterized protein LOC132571442 [Heteronotia binoei]
MSESSIYISTGDTAFLPASLNFSLPMPNYFQLRWSFVTGGWLVLKLKANSCTGQTGTQHWRDFCEISIETKERYRQRAKLFAEDASLVLQDVRTEDSGIYRVTVLALDMTSSANINLTVIKTDPNIPASFVKAADDVDSMVSNCIRLGVAGMILCLLGLIITVHISSTHCKHRKMTAGDGRQTTHDVAGMESTAASGPGSTFLLKENPSSDELHCNINC